MSSSPSVPIDLALALDALPLFPLPQTVLFPDALLPLHIFEPRYRALVRDVLATHRSLAIVLITDPSDVDAQGHPRIASVAGVGTILEHVELPQGRFNILVRGRARVQLDELPFVPPYRRAAATLLPKEGDEPSELELRALISTASSFAALVRERDPSFEARLPRGQGASALADACAHQLILDARERQAALETMDVAQRVRRLTEVLALQQATLGQGGRSLN